MAEGSLVPPLSTVESLSGITSGLLGAAMDEAAISAQLDAALLNDEEMTRYAANYATDAA